jgi:putative oxidoreductase
MLNRIAPQTYAILRVVAGLMFAMHGSQKLLGWPAREGGGGGELPPLMMLAGTIELVGGLLIAIGLFTTVAAFLASGQMAVAYFMAHAPQSPLPLQNRGELAALYCFVFLCIAANGAGIWSAAGARTPRAVPGTLATGAFAPPETGGVRERWRERRETARRRSAGG